MQTRKSPYQIIKERYVTEKAQVLGELATSTSNKSVSRCDRPKYVFLVDSTANKAEIKSAIEEIYAKKKVAVKSVNTINIHPKKRVVRGRRGFKSGFKKAIVTFAPGNTID